MSTQENSLKGQHVRQDKGDSISQAIYGTTHAWDIGYEGNQPVYPLGPLPTTGYILKQAGEDTVALITTDEFYKYAGIAELAARYYERMTVRLTGVVYLVPGLVAITAGDIVQATPDIYDGAAALKAQLYDGDIIPAFYRGQITVAAGVFTADAAFTLPTDLEMLKIISAKLFVGKSADVGSPAAVTDLTVTKDGFAIPNAAANTGAGEICLNGTQGQYATQFQIGDTTTDAIIVIDGWIKSNKTILPPWFIGTALRNGVVRINAEEYVLVPVKLRGH